MKHRCRNFGSWRRGQKYLAIVGIFIVFAVSVNIHFGYKIRLQRSILHIGKISSLVSDTPNHLIDKRNHLIDTRNRMIDTGNPLIDKYQLRHENRAGEEGRGVVLTLDMKPQLDRVMDKYHVNTIVSDDIPLNRKVPDSRINGCKELVYDVDALPDTSIIIPFYDEWPSVLYRTVYSVINRTPRRLVREVILVDDCSTDAALKQDLDDYIAAHFPPGLVKVLRQPRRMGLIKARMVGVTAAQGKILVFFDSHMEVNINWLPPLLTEIVRNRSVVAMATLDYIKGDTFEYRYNDNYLTRYFFDWRMVFFETFFRPEQTTPNTTNPRPGPTMVGAAYAIDKSYFLELGGYDEGMTVWGGENLEMSWRVWLCGGQLLHVPCSRIGHIARAQPYSFPGGRQTVENFNYKRAAEVWLGQYAKFVYYIRPTLKTLDVGDLSSRLELKKRLKCKDFSWYLKNVLPELNIYDGSVKYWGYIQNNGTNKLCLDNAGYLFQMVEPLKLQPCSNDLHAQGFSLTNDHRLRTSLQCVIAQSPADGTEVKLEDCLIGGRDNWDYNVHDNTLVHQSSGLCMDVGTNGPVVRTCNTVSQSQKWTFLPIYL